jgi:sugar/nucleoside kinase (ribokinase family)
MRVTVIGDSTLDVTVRPATAPRAGGDVPARISLSPGGQGANVAVRLARAGLEVRLAAAIADDAPGRLLSDALEADRVAVVRLAAERSGLVISLLDAAGERAMLSDRVMLDPSGVAAACAKTDWVHCSAYPLADDATADALAVLLGSLPSTTIVSAGGGSLPDDPALAGRVRRRLSTAGVRLLIVGRDEASALLDQPLPSLPAAADALAAAFPSVIAVVTGAAAGSAAAGPGFALSVPAVEPATPMVDATGAGDAYVAALIARLLGTDWPPDATTLRDAMERGTREGGLVARVVGAQGRTGAEAGSR